MHNYRLWKSFLALSLLITSYSVFVTNSSAEEQLTITTYYPSPSGSYNELGVNKLAVDINGVAVPSEYDAMNNGDAHIGRSLIVGAGGGSGFAYDELIGPPDNRPRDGSVLIKGSVGIGMTNPIATLTVGNNVSGLGLGGNTWVSLGLSGAKNAAGITMGSDTVSNRYLQMIWNDNSNYGIVTTSGSTQPLLLQTNGGNVGIGIQIPTAKLDVRGGAIFAQDGGAAAPAYSFNADSNTGIYRAANEQMTLVANGQNALTIDGTSGRGVVLASDGLAGRPAYSFTNDNNTGIYRLNNDQMALVANGQEALVIDGTSNVGRILAYNNGTAATPSYSFYSDSNTGIYRFGNDKMNFAANGQDALTIDGTSGTGRVGIGTPNPNYPLDVAGNVNARSVTAQSSNGLVTGSLVSGETGVQGWSVMPGGMGAASGSVGTYINGKGYIGIYGNGLVGGDYAGYFDGQTWCTSGLWAGSDLRWKKNIHTLSNPLEKLSRLRGVEFYWKREEFKENSFPEGKQVGIIAQELEKEFPELVITQKSGYKGIDYTRFTAVLLEAIKAQEEEIEGLKKELASLSQKVNQGK